MAPSLPTSIAAPPSTTATEGVRRREGAANTLLHTLFIEAFQTERSADVHSRREADRFGSAPPAVVLRAVAVHARGALVDLSTLAATRGFWDTCLGVALGSLFSSLRDILADRFIDRERSYRGTLLGMRHGIDLMHLLRLTADAAGDTALAAYCDAWRSVRVPLVEAVAAELTWFATNPQRALEGAKGSWGDLLKLPARW